MWDSWPMQAVHQGHATRWEKLPQPQQQGPARRSDSLQQPRASRPGRYERRETPHPQSIDGPELGTTAVAASYTRVRLTLCSSNGPISIFTMSCFPSGESP